MLWLTCSLLEVSSGLGICQESFLPGPQKSGFQLEIAIFFSGFFFSSLSSGKSISIIKFLEGTILTKMKKVKLSQHKVMFELTCAKVSFWNFQSMKLSLDWLFIFIFAGKKCFYIHIFMGEENCFPCSCILQVDSCIFHGYEHSGWGCHSSSLSWSYAGFWKWPELPWNCPEERRAPGQQTCQGQVAMQTIYSVPTPKELYITSFIFPACNKTEFMKSKVLIETCAVGPLQEAALEPSSPGGYGCPLLQILQVSKSEWKLP